MVNKDLQKLKKEQDELEKGWKEIDVLVRKKVGMCPKCWRLHKKMVMNTRSKMVEMFNITPKDKVVGVED